MRQAGYLAAAGIFALNNNRDDLKKDHVKAKEIGETLEKCSFINSIEPIETNIIIFSLKDFIDEELFINRLKEKNILLISLGKGKLQMVHTETMMKINMIIYLKHYQKLILMHKIILALIIIFVISSCKKNKPMKFEQNIITSKS